MGPGLLLEVVVFVMSVTSLEKKSGMREIKGDQW